MLSYTERFSKQEPGSLRPQGAPRACGGTGDDSGTSVQAGHPEEEQEVAGHQVQEGARTDLGSYGTAVRIRDGVSTMFAKYHSFFKQ